jgi:plastocyanin
LALRRLLILEFTFAAVCALAGMFTIGTQPRRVAAARPDDEASAAGSICGKIVYKSDPQHPWRLGRYYIRSAKTGELAEAVVALYRGGLKGPETAREPQTVTIDQRDFQFTPETVAIRAGDRVKFTNSDPQVHNVRTTHVKQNFNVNMPAGGEHIQLFPAAGGIRQPYYVGCAFHNAMHAWVFVFDHPWYQATGKDGAFELADVPPGDYRIEVVHPAGDLRASKNIIVKAGETLSVDFELSPADLMKNREKEK